MNRVRTILVALSFVPTIVLAQERQPTVQDIPFLLTYSCAVGAVEVAYALGREKLSGTPDRDAFVIANASKRRCISPGYVKSIFPNVDPQTLSPQDEIFMLVDMKYLSFVNDIVSARGRKQ